MRCPSCRSYDTVVKNSRRSDSLADGRHTYGPISALLHSGHDLARMRDCLRCGHRFFTVEQAVSEEELDKITGHGRAGRPQGPDGRFM